jgi:hypothetical protein
VSTIDDSIPELLRGVCDDLDAASTHDAVSLARPRAKLAWIASLVPASRERRLLDAAAEVASSIGLYEAQADADVTRLDATRQAVELVVRCLGRENTPDAQLDSAGRQLMRSVGRDPADWQRDQSAERYA